jgi:hypothetical protein
VRKWLDLQGAARLQKATDEQHVADCTAEENPKAAKIRNRGRKARRQSKSLPVNVARIDPSLDFRPA